MGGGEQWTSHLPPEQKTRVLIPPGVDVMITIFSGFLTIFGEKIGVFLKNQSYDQNFASISFVLSQKRQFFAIFFGENILKIITSVPGRKVFRET
jgi:hypothetical protein